MGKIFIIAGLVLVFALLVLSFVFGGVVRDSYIAILEGQLAECEAKSCDECPVVEHEVVDCGGKSIRDCFAERDKKQAALEELAKEVAEILEVKN